MNRQKVIAGSLMLLLLIGGGCASQQSPVEDENIEQNNEVEEPIIDEPAEPVVSTTPVVNVEISTSTKIMTPSIKTFSITAKNWEFTPNTITVKKGDTVKLSIASVDVTHGFKLPEFNVSADLVPGKTTNLEFVASKAGTFTYFCNVFCGEGHRDMKGTLIVE